MGDRLLLLHGGRQYEVAVPRGGVSVGDLFWFGPLKFMSELMFQTPLVNAFIFGSFVYHDYIWYPSEGRKVVDKWLANTEWGQLFLQYGDPFANESQKTLRDLLPAVLR